MSILISPLSRVHAVVADRRPACVISLLDPGFGFPDLGPAYADRHLRLSFHDAHTAMPGVTLPDARHIAEMLAFLDRWRSAESVLVHCRAGIGRSTATAFVVACHRNERVPELSIARELRRAGPLSRPNETLVALADTAMRRAGRMSSAIAVTGRGLDWIDVAEGEPFELPLQFTAEPRGAGNA
jgi:predicted protein tyrosine phosphatase